MTILYYKLSHHPTKFGGHRHCSSGDIMVFGYHVTLKDHVIKALNEFMLSRPSRYVTILPSLVAIGTVMVDWRYNNFSLPLDLVRPRNQKVMWFYGLESFMVSHHSFMVSHKFGGHRHCGNGDTMLLVVKGQDSTGPCFSLPVLLISKGHGLKARGKQLCDNWKPSFLLRLLFNWRTFSRRVPARWLRQSAKNQVLINQNSKNRWTICI